MIGTERPTADILGVDVDRVDMDSAIARIEELLAAGGAHQVVVLSVDSVMNARRDRKFRSVCGEASLVVPDGVPILWASRLLGRPIPGRVAGSDLLRKLCGTAARRGYTCFFLGSTSCVLDRLAAVVSRDFPGLRIAGTYAPPVYTEFPPEENAEIARRVNSTQPDILWVSMGAPKQEKWIRDNLGALEAKIVIGVGAAFDLASNSVQRAPEWMQRAGLEWFHRFLKEPRRLFARYFIDALPFFPLLLLQGLREIFSGRRFQPRA